MAVPEFAVRAPRADDFNHIVGVLHACEQHDLDDTEPLESIAIDLRAEWDRPKLDLSRDAWVGVAADGAPIAYAHVTLRSPDTAFLAPTQGVHPARRGRGVG